ncbi:MAG: hypothetical protein ACRD2Z_06110 [Thermoanaerobaculia bacterium]
MDKDSQRLVWIAAGVLFAAVVAVLVVPRARETLAPEPVRAFVAIEVDGEGVARTGDLELTSGMGFRLHAVIEAVRRGGEALYYTEAPALEIDGEPVPAERVRPWDRSLEARVLWFGVEGVPPFVAGGDREAIGAVRFQEIFRADWPQAWSVPGSVEPTSERLARGRDAHGPFPFGTAAYQVRVLLYGPESEIRARQRLASPGGEALATGSDPVARVEVTLPGRLAAASRVFGLPQIEPAEGSPLPPALARLLEQGLAFRRAQVLAATLGDADRRWEELAWETVDPEAGPPWGEEGVEPGDLVRAGGRVVILYRDQGDGRLGRGDLAFDFVDGPAVRALNEIFVGEGLLEWAAL